MMRVINGLLILSLVVAGLAFVHFEFIKPGLEENRQLQEQLESSTVEQQIHPSLPLRNLERIATMPEDRVARRVIDMMVGETAFVARGALVVDEPKRCWLHPQAVAGATISDQSLVTFMLKITRVADGFEVEINDASKYRWTPELSVPASYFPVVKISSY